jgi:PAS domain S-box-containing protein
MPSRASQDRRTQAEILEKIFDHIPVMINFIDTSGRIELVNPEWERILGWSLEEVQAQGLDIFTECYPDPRYRQYVLDFAAAAEGIWADFKTRVRDGRIIDTTWVTIRLSDGTTIGIGQDITDRKRTQEALRTFSRRLVEVQEGERRRVARELHDEIGQILTGLTLILETSTRLQARSRKDALAEAQRVAKDLLARVRTMSLDLRPATLDDLGLLPALLWHFERYTTLTGVRVIFGQNGLASRRFEPEIETAAYRIVQEALTNVARHSAAQEAVVWATATLDLLTLRVEDHGTGFDSEAVLSGGRSSGLLGMRERARLLNGAFTVESAPRSGTSVIAELPIAPSR